MPIRFFNFRVSPVYSKKFEHLRIPVKISPTKETIIPSDQIAGTYRVGGKLDKNNKMTWRCVWTHCVVDYPIMVLDEGAYNLSFMYSTNKNDESDSRGKKIYIDDKLIRRLALPDSDGFYTETPNTKIILNKGLHILRFEMQATINGKFSLSRMTTADIKIKPFK